MVLVGCGESESPRISILDASTCGDIEAVKRYLAAGKNLNAKSVDSWTSLHHAAIFWSQVNRRTPPKTVTRLVKD